MIKSAKRLLKASVFIFNNNYRDMNHCKASVTRVSVWNSQRTVQLMCVQLFAEVIWPEEL